MKLIEGKKQRYLLAKENIEDYEYNNRDYFLQENKDNYFVVDLNYIKSKKEIVLITQYSKEYAKKVDEERLEEIIKEKVNVKPIKKIIEEDED